MLPSGKYVVEINRPFAIPNHSDYRRVSSGLPTFDLSEKLNPKKGDCTKDRTAGQIPPVFEPKQRLYAGVRLFLLEDAMLFGIWRRLAQITS